MAYYLGGPSYSLTLHGPLSDYGPAQHDKWSSAAFGIVITETLRVELEAAVGVASLPQLVVCGMGVDADRLQRSTPYQPWQPHAGAFRVFSCARLNPVKGHADLVEAARLMRERGLDVHVRIAGEDEHGGAGYRRELEALISASGMKDHVELLGAVPEETVVSELMDAHAFVLASWEEPLGVAVMESMASGVPTVAPRAGGVPRLIDHDRDGLLVQPRNPGELAESLTRIAEHSDTAVVLGRRAAQTARRRSRGFRSADVLAEMMGRHSTTSVGTTSVG
jgi:glycosyltransferase involved in cell wall biosynthesis